MIRSFQARNYRMLVGNRLQLRPFQVLVGLNATGKTTFLDALQFVADVLTYGLRHAVQELRAPSFYDLCFKPSEPISFAIEVEVPAGVDEREPEWKALRYEIELGVDQSEGMRVSRENLFILPPVRETRQPSLFGDVDVPVLHDKTPKNWRKVISKTAEGRDYFQDERTQWNNVFRFGIEKAALGSLPEDPARFPLSISVRNLLRDGVRTLALDARKMRKPSPPGGKSRLQLDGSNLPYVVRELNRHDPVLFREWVGHLATAVEGLRDVEVRERPEDKHLVLEATFSGVHDKPVPSWLLSDGTLRLMALTLLSYAAAKDESDVYLIEEPENGLHPLAIQAAYQVLAEPPGAMQVLCATHSPVFLAKVRLEDTLVFRRSRDGYAIARRGTEVPELEQWASATNLSDLLVTGVLS